MPRILLVRLVATSPNLRAAMMIGAILLGVKSWALCTSAVAAPLDRQKYLDQTPLAEVAVQTLGQSQEPTYTAPNVGVISQQEQEDPLSLYARTQDGEWLIPEEVQREDPWLRLLILGPSGPVIVDVALEISGQPYRVARELWIDRLQEEAKKALIRRAKAEMPEASSKPDAARESIPDESIPDESAAVVKEPAQESASESLAKTAGSEEAGEAEAEPEVPVVAVKGRQTRNLANRLINVLALDQSNDDPNSTSESEAREQVRWLLAEWTGGPGLLTLGPAYAWQRAEIAPLWQALDQDSNLTLSSGEISQAEEVLNQADINQDDAIDLNELERLGESHSGLPHANSHPLVIVIDGQTDWRALQQHLQHAYPGYAESPSAESSSAESSSAESSGENSSSAKDALGLAFKMARDMSELKKILALPPDIVYQVSFGVEQAKVRLLTVGGEGENDWQFISATQEVLTVEQQAMYLELTAAQGKVDVENTAGDMAQTQIAVGAIADGYPLFRMLDHDNNQQLTPRERHEVIDFLLGFDRNQDGQLERSEVPTAVRLAVTLGPQVHRHLSRATSAQRKLDDPTGVAAPEWFRDMDRNGDGDLSRREFKGNPSQFSTMDRDGDGLISQKEIQEIASDGE